jgi:hypothetical protein
LKIEGEHIDFIGVGILPTLHHQFTQQLAYCFSWFLLPLGRPHTGMRQDM